MKKLLAGLLLSLFSLCVLAANTATLTWTAPTTNTDGTSFSTAQLPITYTVLSGACGSETVLQTGVTATTLVISTGLADGSTVCFKVLAVDATGTSSAPSAEVSKSFPKAVPNPPTNLTVQ